MNLKKILFLRPVPTLLIAIPSYGLVIYTLAGEDVDPVIGYVSYFLSAYAFAITITGAVKMVCFVRQRIKQHPVARKVLGIPFVVRYFKEDTFRADTALYQGFLINLFNAGIKMFSGVFYNSIWFTTLAVYYILLAFMRFYLLLHVRKGWAADKNNASGWRRYRLCGIVLLFMNVALSGIVILVIRQNGGFEYPGVLIYIMAMYAFYVTTTAIRNVVKFRRYGSPILSAAKAINLTAALASMLSLETAMLAQFGTMEDLMFREIMTASTGAGISVSGEADRKDHSFN